MKPFWKVGGATAKVQHTTAVPERLRTYVREVVSVRTATNRRGLGDAKSLMHAICAEADRLRYVLLLVPQGDLDCPVTDERLAEWYGDFGFLQLPNGEAMARPLKGH
jgi:hypothetical protein